MERLRISLIWRVSVIRCQEMKETVEGSEAVAQEKISIV